MDAQQCGFGYRDSVFKRLPPGSCLIAAVTLRYRARFEAQTDYPDVKRELEQWAFGPARWPSLKP